MQALESSPRVGPVPAGPPALGDGMARVWLIDSAVLPQPLEPLDAAEQQSAAALNCPARAQAYRAAHQWTRWLLRRELGAGPQAIGFVRRPGGKPELDPALAGAAPLRFNHSHTQGYVACAIARGVEVGVDIEEMVPLDELPGLQRFVMHPQEQAGGALDPAQPTLDRFFVLWTAKEALLKATGHGLSVSLRHIALRETAPQMLQLVLAPQELGPFIGTLIGHGVLVAAGRRYAYATALLRPDAQLEVLHVAAAAAGRTEGA